MWKLVLLYLLLVVTRTPFSVEKASEGSPWMFQSLTTVGLPRNAAKEKSGVQGIHSWRTYTTRGKVRKAYDSTSVCTISEPNIMSTHDKVSSMQSQMQTHISLVDTLYVFTEGRKHEDMHNTTNIVSLPAHLFEPSLLHQLITVVREEWSSIWQEGSSHQTVSNQIPHAHLQFLSGKATSIVTSYYVHRAYHKYNDTLTFSSHRTLSPASPDTSLAARSNLSSVSSAFFRSSSLWASFSSYCRCSSSSLSFTSRNFSFASWRMACFSASLWFASSNFWKGK